MEISELNRVAQRLRSEIDSVKKQVLVLAFYCSASYMALEREAQVTGGHLPNVESGKPLQVLGDYSGFHNSAAMLGSLQGNL